MKKLFIFLFAALVFYSFIYFWNLQEKDKEQHPTIHQAAAKPDEYLLEVKDFEDEKRHDKSVKSIEKAIQAIWTLENDVDEANFDRLEQAIERLETAHKKIIRDSISGSELQTTLEYAHSMLAHVELQVAEKYIRENDTRPTKAALKYAQLHIKNTLILQSSSSLADSLLISTEKLLLRQIDSLFDAEDISKAEYLDLLDKMIREIDEITYQIDEK